ncbi:PIR Superfamily Protein [Plasmodium ovale wallikeri]|uniref:PIR Superfamily Protein n=1 Tax=Plasmodium ovale wallikeri TaxID=864142 RepID=A0A1A9AJM5_PLAOA|nr:PIR Superfamily Protein [Plasmodium ovale wallikeri]SBT56369.1 PIR Superfamily Protein [Plasmodium ovale wallikeri]
MSSEIPDIYSFFEMFTEYKRYESYIDTNFLEIKRNTKCHSYLYDQREFGTDSANNICVKFKILRDVIESKKKPNPTKLDDRDFAYINYWLNGRLRNTTVSNKLTAYHFQDTMTTYENDLFNYSNLDKKLYDIREDDYQNMKLLEYLHLNYFGKFTEISRLTEEKKILCFEYVKELFDTYKKGIIQCPHDNSNFCKALKHFKGEYEKIYLGKYDISKKCSDGELLKLPTYEDVSRNKQITIVGTVLGPSFGTLFTLIFLYKFTPFGQWLHAKIGTNRGTHSKIYELNDEPLLNTSDLENINFDENPYHISYDAVGNL